MTLFFTILFKLTPLYLNILLGYIGGKVIKTPCEAISRLMFYLINPLIMFSGIVYTKISPNMLTLPILVFVLSSGISLLFYRFAGLFWKDFSRSLIAFNAGSGNTGYFGLPLAILLFTNQGEGIYMIALLGITLFENSIGFYLCAKGTHTPSECVQKLIRVPTIHAFFLALLVNYLAIPIPTVFAEFMLHIKGTYLVLGMMIVGLALSSLQHLKLDFKFIGISFFCKFLVWPAIILGLIYIDTRWLGLYSQDIHQALILLSIVPLPVNSVILASVLKASPEKAATAVLLSTIFALFFVPFMIITFIVNFSHLFDPFCI